MDVNELAWAREALLRMQSAADMVGYEKSWKDFLHYLDRAWNKLEKGLHADGGAQRHLREVNRWRKEDDLLRYLVQARNTDEHTIQAIVVNRSGGLTITGGPGGGRIHKGIFNGSGHVDNLVYDGDLEIKFHPDRLEVISVTSRGVTYSPPENHMGSPVKSRLPHELAQMALEYYETKAQQISQGLSGHAAR